VSVHGRRRPGPQSVGVSPVGPAQLGWVLLVIAAALIGGLAAAALVHTSLAIAVIVSVVAGGIAVLAALRSPARPPELGAGEPGGEDFGRYPAPSRRPAPSAAPVPAETDGQTRGGSPAGTQTVAAAGRRAAAERALVGLGSGGAARAESGRQAGARSGPVHLPGLYVYRAVPALRRVPARHRAGQERLGFPL
jgi:hypothetical protein